MSRASSSIEIAFSAFSAFSPFLTLHCSIKLHNYILGSSYVVLHRYSDNNLTCPLCLVTHFCFFPHGSLSFKVFLSPLPGAGWMPGTCGFEKGNPLSGAIEYNTFCMFGHGAFHSLSFDSPCETESYFCRFNLAMPVKKKLHSKTHIKRMTIQMFWRLFPQLRCFCKSTSSARISSHQNVLSDESLERL